MKKIFICLIVILMSSNCIYADNTRIVRQHPYINNPYYRHNDYYMEEVLPDDLSALEKYAMNRVYRRENPVKRLERLEDLTFGSIQSGDIQSRYKNVESAILARPKNNAKRTALGTLANYFAGQATGLTPPVFTNYGNGYSFDNYGFNSMNGGGYGTSRINQYSNGIFGGGYGILNNSVRNGSTIRMLD